MQKILDAVKAIVDDKSHHLGFFEGTQEEMDQLTATLGNMGFSANWLETCPPQLVVGRTGAIIDNSAKEAAETDAAWALLLERGFPLPSTIILREAAIDAIDAQYYAGPMIAGPWHIDKDGDWARSIIISKPREGNEVRDPWGWNCVAAYVSDEGAHVTPVVSDESVENEYVIGPRYPYTDIELAKQWCDAQLTGHGWLLK